MKPLRDFASRGLNSIWYGNNPLCWVLLPLSLLVRLLVGIRRLAYRKGWLESIDVGVPVVVIGNLTPGGTGKTPLTIWLAGQLAAKGLRVGIVCRGYGGTALEWPQTVTAASDALLVGDEPCLLARRTGCPVVAGPDRVAAARQLLEQQPVDLILTDDGLQHYRLRRTVEIAVIDGVRRLGNGFCLPAGPLREPVSRLAEVDAVVVNSGELTNVGAPQDKSAHRFSVKPLHLESLDGKETRELAGLAGQTVHAVAGIGNPGRFFDLLRRLNINVLEHPHADHSVLQASELQFSDGHLVLITEKDAVKCRHLKPGDVFVVLTDIEMDPPDATHLLDAISRKLVPGEPVQ